MNLNAPRMTVLMFAASYLTASLMAVPSTIARADSTVTVNTNLLEQQINGFGGSDAWQASAIRAFPTEKRNKILNLLFSTTNGAGLSMLRHRIPVEIEASPGVWNWTTDGDTIWLTTQALNRGVRTVWSTPWTPPAWMKTNDDPNNGGELAASHYQDYANYLAAYIQNYKALLGVTIDDISIQNEPDQTQPYESCTWTSQEFHDFIANNLAPTFKADGIKTKVLMPEFSGWSDALASDTLADPTTSNFISIIAAHDYGGTIAPFTDALMAGKPVWETEDSNLGPNDSTIVDAINWAEIIQNTLVVGKASAWNWWWLYSTNASDGEDLINGNSTLTDFTVNKRLWSIGNFSRFVRPGSNLIGLLTNTPEAGVYVTAFRNTTSGKLIIVAINQNTASTNLTLNLPAFNISSVTPYETSATQDLAALSPVSVTNGAFTSMLDAQSVTTFVGQGAVANPAPPVQIACGENGAAPFVGDFDYDVGNPYTVTTSIDTSGVQNPAPQAVYQSERWFPTAFKYAIPGLVAKQKYTVRLHFSENYFTKAGQREFNVTIDGGRVLTNFDIFAAAGGASKAVVKQFVTVAPPTGKITISFSPGPANNPKIDGIEVLNHP